VGCFPANAVVRSSEGSSLLLSNVALGDSLQTVAADGTLGARPVHFWGHKDAAAVSMFFSVETASGHTLTLTGDHLLPVATTPTTPWEGRTFKRAQNIVVGDHIWVMKRGNISVTSVQQTTKHVGEGLYNPYTEHGTTVVNDVVVSDHSQWVLDGFIGDDYVWLAPILYAPLLQTVLAKVYSATPQLIEAISECFHATAAAGTSFSDAVCALQAIGRQTRLYLSEVLMY